MLRLVSAAVLIPVVLVAAYLGGWVFFGLCVLGALGVLWEWSRLAGSADAFVLAPGAVALVAALALTGFGHAAAAVGAVVIGAVAAGAGAFVSGSAGQSAPVRGIWAVGGVIYAGAAFLGPALLRRDAELGFAAFLFLALTVWATDTCAFAIGRATGGPLLWPRVSPNKTWSGAIGGLAGGVAGGTLVAYADGLGRLAAVGVIALVLSALAQAGDLLESAIKRHFGAKDASQLIPGHGGLMDRLDGFLVAAAAALLIGILRQGTGAAAHGLLVW
jgi:phosphatidate cytidylyltransferase